MTKTNPILLLLVLLIALFLQGIIKGQPVDTVYVHADSIENGNVTLNDVWLFKSGDDTLWASPDFDDSGWDKLRTRIPFDDAAEIPWTGIGWYRTVIRIDSSLRFKPVAFIVNQFGASSFYLNGKLVKELGTIADSAEYEELLQPRNIPFTVILDNSLIYNIAVRYSNKIALEESRWYKNWFGPVGFTLSLREIDSGILDVVSNERISIAVNMGIGGIFFSLGLLYLALFTFYSTKKENLYFALFNLSLTITFVFSMLNHAVRTDLDLAVIYSAVSASTLILVFPFYLGFLYSIFYKKLPKLFYYICGVSVLIIMTIVFQFAEVSVYDYIILLSIFILTLEGLRIIIIAIKNNKPNSRIIGTGVIVFVSFVITLFVFGIFGLNLGNFWGLVIFIIGLFSLPLSMSIYLARDIALTNKNLKKQLDMVKELSASELEHHKQTAELTLQSEKEIAVTKEAELRAQIAEAENERKSKELEEARQLQLSMLPKELPQLPHLDIAVYMQTATEVGGDYYDFHVDIDGTLTVVIGDATGHGMKAGTMVTAAKSIFNSYVNNPDIIFTFQEFTRIIKMMKLQSMSMCLSLLKIRGDQMEMSAAGMPHALLYRNSNSTVEEIVLKGMPLGAVNNFPYKIANKELFPGDSILLLSDGLPELFNNKKEMFGYERVPTEFSKIASESPDDIIQYLKTIASEWVNGGEPNDDITFVVMKVK
jgi:serine phosphatase RsbU (regulator of sigma subunit)